MAAVTLESTNQNSAMQLKIDNQLAKKYPFDWQVRVYYEDTDSGGVVYHSNYLKYMERARTEWLRHLGFEQADLNDKLNNDSLNTDSLNNDTLNALFVVHSMQIQFKNPAKLNDLLTISSELTTIGFGSIVFTKNRAKYTASRCAESKSRYTE